MSPSSLRPLLLILTGFLLGCEPAEKIAPPGLDGYVVSAGKPVSGASISLANGTQLYATTSDNAGKFKIDQIATGEYVLTVKSENEAQTFSQIQKNVSILNTSSQTTIELPQGVTLMNPSEIGSSALNLKWTRSAVSDFLEYKLYRHSTPGLDETTGTLIQVATNVKDTTFQDSELQDNQTYYYRVFVRNSFGFYSGSNVVSVTTAQANHVVNGDFELGLNSWELYSLNPCVALKEDVTAPAGSKVLKADINETSRVNTNPEIFQVIDHTKLIPGQTYTLTFWAKASLPGTSAFNVYLQSSANYSYAVSIKLNSSANRSWTKYSKDFVAPASSAPFWLFVYAEPNIPWSGQHLEVLLDGLEIKRK